MLGWKGSLWPDLHDPGTVTAGAPAEVGAKALLGTATT